MQVSLQAEPAQVAHSEGEAQRLIYLLVAVKQSWLHGAHSLW